MMAKEQLLDQVRRITRSIEENKKNREDSEKNKETC
jgi:hypothetical protein